MNSYLALTKLLMKTIAMSTITDKRKKFIFYILLSIVVLFIFIPFVLCCGLFVYSSTITLNEVGYSSIGLEFFCIVLSIFTFTFSFNVLLNQLYFSEDIEHILPLPIKQQVVLLAKFTACFMAENIMEFLLLLVSVLGYCIALNLGIKHILISLVGIVTLPIIPMVYCGIISILLMNFTKFIKNKETIRKISIVFMLFIMLLFVNSIGYLQQFDFDKYIVDFALGNHKFLDIMRIIFPHIYLFVDSVTNCSIGSLILYLCANVLYICILLFVGKLFYYKSVIGLSSKNTDSVSKYKLNTLKENSVFKAYLSKEFKILFRSPTYFINCILINVLWPLFVYIIYKICFSKYSINQIILLRDSNKLFCILTMFIVGVSIIVPALNSIASSSFSREGSSFYFMKYIPVKYGLQWTIKVITSFIVCFIGINVLSLIFYLIIRLSIIKIIYLIIVSALCILFVSLLGVLIDSIQPKLIWDDEANSLRENYNTFMVMGFALLISVLLIFGMYFSLSIGINSLFKEIILLVLLLMIDALIYKICVKDISKNIILQEEL